jgi:hypothetical protein
MATQLVGVAHETALRSDESGAVTTVQVTPPSDEVSTSGAATRTQVVEEHETSVIGGVPSGTATGSHVCPPSVERASTAVPSLVAVPQATQVAVPDTQVTPVIDMPAGNGTFVHVTPPSPVRSAVAWALDGFDLPTVTQVLVVGQAMPVTGVPCSGGACSVHVTPPSTDFSTPRLSGT